MRCVDAPGVKASSIAIIVIQKLKQFKIWVDSMVTDNAQVQDYSQDDQHVHDLGRVLIQCTPSLGQSRGADMLIIYTMRE